MIDLDTFRARVGQFNSKTCVGYGKKAKLQCCRDKGQQCGKVVCVLAVASIILIMIAFTDVSSGGGEGRDCFYSVVQGLPTLGNILPYLRGPIRAQNYRLKASDLNAYMKAINGNKTCIDVAHWNGGSSHLGKSSKGREKLLHARFLLSKYNVDVLGLSEANLHKSVDSLEYKINNYKVFHQDLKIARIVTYVREDVDCKVEESLMDDNIACIWLWIGRGRARWLVSQVYREHMFMGDRESSTAESQMVRWRRFLEKVRETEKYENVVIM